MRGAGIGIGRVLMNWDGVTAQPHRFGGAEFWLGGQELGHTHGDVCVDIRFPTVLRDEVVGEGWAEAHPVLPGSGWVTVPLRAPEDIGRAVRLLRRAYELALAQGARVEEVEPSARAVTGGSREFF